MLKQMGSFDSNTSLASRSQDSVNTSRKSDEFACQLPPKIPKYGTESNPRFRKPFISMENSPTGLSVGEYKQLLDVARSGLVSFDSRPLTASRKEIGLVFYKKLYNSGTSTIMSSVVSLASPDADDWCSRVSNTPYLSEGWLSNLTSAVTTSMSRREKQRAKLEEEIRFWNNRVHLHYGPFSSLQRKLSEEAKVNELEMRLSCLLRTPPVLQDPYLQPQPIPQELPYKRPVKSKLPGLLRAH
ncbi:unnamed protein product [Hydatigera taeniaeformis]|uniref:Coiled-coil domain containing 33 n=1 Tax=Hydatigena taeniaeformis TaxID=6205 RepID=A0A0R3WQX0_HYDTA|nr:unnamed protein product [Hydatigera taeniaeformis]